MTKPTIPPVHDDLTFHGPLSEARADLIIRSFGSLDGAHVVDLGCGWAELLLRTVAASTATGLGIDLDAEAIEHGRANAAARGLSERVTLETGDASKWTDDADVLIVNGATHVWGGDPVDHTTITLTEAHRRLRPGGRLLLGEGFWERQPTDAELAAMEVPPDQYRALPDLVDLAMAHGYRPLWLSRANRDEWDEFESGHALGWERWLAVNPDSPHRAGIIAQADGHRRAWQRGWQDVMGFAYLTLLAI